MICCDIIEHNKLLLLLLHSVLVVPGSAIKALGQAGAQAVKAQTMSCRSVWIKEQVLYLQFYRGKQTRQRPALCESFLFTGYESAHMGIDHGTFAWR